MGLYLLSIISRFILSLLCSRYESQSLEIEEYFPNVLSQVNHMEEYRSRKQSLYYETKEHPENAKKSFEDRQYSEQNESRPFRVRSGTDISNSLISARFKFKRSQSKVIQDQETILELEKSGSKLTLVQPTTGDETRTSTSDLIFQEIQDKVLFDLYEPGSSPRTDLESGDPQEIEEFEDCLSRKPSCLEMNDLVRT